ncbi:UNVERIFIED_ORG: 23S rRNA m(1)G-748 methyltransferase [Dietzia maris]
MSGGPTAPAGPGPAAFERVVRLLRCPVCGQGMEAVDRAVVCAAGHSFDRARQGHLSLFGPRGRRFPGDGADQVAARDRVLGSGLFDPLVAILAGVAREALGPGACGVRSGSARPVVLEPGAGTGFYLAGVVDALAAAGRPTGELGTDEGGPDESGPAVLGVGTEISTAAARRLARVHDDVAALVADTWDGLPLADDCVDLVQVVFAPRNPAEFARVLLPGGTLVVAVPGPGHLEPLRSAGGMLEPAPDKSDRLDADLADHFRPGEVRTVDVLTEVPAPVAVDLALMGPSGVHLDRSGLEARLGPQDRPVRIHVEVHTYRALPAGRPPPRPGEPLQQ